MPLRVFIPQLLGFAAIVIATSGIRVTKQSERLVVFRLGRFLRVVGPGMSLTIPFIDRAVRVNLDKAVPDWRSVDQRELWRRIEELIRRPVAPR